MTSPSITAKVPSLIRTKLNKPRISADLIQRHDLLERLNRGLQRKTTLVFAPAGYGKTTLICMWLDGCQWPSAWLSLDESDSDLGVFLGYFIAAIQSIIPGACSETMGFLQASQLPPIDDIVALLINEVAALPLRAPPSSNPEFVLVLDDYHRIHDPLVHQLVNKLIEYQPEPMHLVIISRHDPTSLPLAQLRARRESVEIRQAELRFDLAETRTLFEDVMGMSLPQDTVNLLDRWIEGWVVGLQLVSLSMQDLSDPVSFVQNLNGSDRYLMAYLVDEVLSHQPQAVQTFLLQTSILDRLCGPLCDAVTEIEDSEGDGQAQLVRLARRNMFLVPLDSHLQWYRYHHLFQDLLADKLKREYSTDEIREYHHRAGQWYAGQGHIEEAIQHALAANDIELATSVVAVNSQQLVNRFEQQALARWLSLLPEDAVWQSPKLLLVQAWLLFLQWRLIALESILDRVEVLLESDVGALPEQEELFIDGQVQTLRSATAYLVDNDFQRSLTAGEQALRHLPPIARGARGIALMMTSYSQRALGQQDRAIHQLTQAIEDRTPNGPAEVQVFLGLSLLHLTAADLTKMQLTSDHFLTFVSGSREPNAIGAASYVAGLLKYEWNDLLAAEAHFSRMFELRYRSNFLGGFNAGLALVRICQIRGDLEQAKDLIGRLRGDTLRIGNTDLLPGLDAAQAELWLLQGNIASAIRWARSFKTDVTRDKIFKFELPLLAKTRILVKHGTDADAGELQQRLETELVDLETHHFTYCAIQTRAHLALVFNCLGLADDALETLRQAITLAQPGGIIRSFADCGPSLIPLLQQLQMQEVAPNYLAQVLAAFPTDQRPTTGGVRDLVGSDGIQISLTAREIEVLHLVQAGLTNQEIADGLVISVYTVKRHITNIYNKLVVDNRVQAVRKARRLGLLSSD